MVALSEILAPCAPFVSSCEIPDEHLETILRAADCSGACGFLLVCCDANLIKEIAYCTNVQDLLSEVACLIIAGQRQSSFPMSRAKSLSIPSFYLRDHIAEADLISSIDQFLVDSCGENSPEEMMKTAIAVSRLVLQASSMGIRSFCEYRFEKSRIMELCGIPSKANDIFCLVGLGGTNDVSTKKDKETTVTLFRDYYGTDWRQQ